MTSFGIEPQATQYTFDIHMGHLFFCSTLVLAHKVTDTNNISKHQKRKTRTIHVQNDAQVTNDSDTLHPNLADHLL